MSLTNNYLKYVLIPTRRSTPVQNDIEELWSTFHWLYPDIFTKFTSKLFKEAFSLTKGKMDGNF